MVFSLLLREMQIAFTEPIGFIRVLKQKEHDVLFAVAGNANCLYINHWFIRVLEQKEHDVLFAFAGNA